MINYFTPMFYMSAGVPSYYALVCDDDIETITTEGYLDDSFSSQFLTPNNGDIVQSIFGDGTKSCTFVTSLNPVGGSVTLVPAFGLNMS
jgi:hypothetical protein